ncbi:MAG: MFS transporter [Candidatus Hermodarchaeota archaeon]
MFKRKNKGTQEEDTPVHKVPIRQKMYFGLSIAGLTFIASTIDGAMLKYYTDFILFPPLLYGIVQLLFAIVNAINDPIIGYYSDRTKPVDGKGKRKRWLISSLPLVGSGYVFMVFMNPYAPYELIFIILLVSFILYDTGYAMNMINRGALMLTVTDDDNERASLVSINLVFQTILGIFSYLLILLFFVEGENPYPFPIILTILVIVGVIGVGVAFYGAKGIKEPTKLYEGETSPDIRKLLKDVVSSKSFIFYILIQFVMGAVSGTVLTFQVFYFGDVLRVSGTEVMIVSAITLPFTFFAYYLVQVVSKKFGPRITLMLFITISVSAFLGLLLSRIFIVAVICYLIINMGNAAFWILSTPIFGYVIDEYELKTGSKPIGTFNGINAIFISPNKQIMTFLFTWILSMTGYVGGTGIIQTEDAKIGIQIGVGLVPIILFGIGFLLLLFFPLRGEKLVEVKKEIKKIYDKRLGEIVSSELKLRANNDDE